MNRYQILDARPDGTEGSLLAFAEQKRWALKEDVTFYADEAKSHPLFSFKAGLGLHPLPRRHLGPVRVPLRLRGHGSGQLVMSSERQKTIRDRYRITLPDSRLDFRVAASMAVALDALQSR